MLLVEGEADFEFLVAVVHEVLEDDRGGDNQRADDERHGVMKEEIADCKDEHRDNNSERIGLDYDYQAEYGGYYSHSEHYEAVRNQREQNAVGCGDRLAAHETVAVNARLGVARNPEGAPHGELQHDVAAHRRIEADRGDRPDLHALNGDGRGGLDPADLRISHIIGNIAAENIDAAQKADAAPQAAQHDDGEHAYLYLSSHNSECLSGDRIAFVTHDVSVAEALLHLRQRTLGFGLRRVTPHTILITVAARGTQLDHLVLVALELPGSNTYANASPSYFKPTTAIKCPPFVL